MSLLSAIFKIFNKNFQNQRKSNKPNRFCSAAGPNFATNSAVLLTTTDFSGGGDHLAAFERFFVLFSLQRQ
jgi:hypothetical protein